MLVQWTIEMYFTYIKNICLGTGTLSDHLSIKTCFDNNNDDDDDDDR